MMTAVPQYFGQSKSMLPIYETTEEEKQ